MPGWAHPRMSTIGQEQSVVVAESGRSTPELGEATAQHVGTASARTTSAFAEAISAAHTLQQNARCEAARAARSDKPEGELRGDVARRRMETLEHARWTQEQPFRSLILRGFSTPNGQDKRLAESQSA